MKELFGDWQLIEDKLRDLSPQIHMPFCYFFHSHYDDSILLFRCGVKKITSCCKRNCVSTTLLPTTSKGKNGVQEISFLLFNFRMA